MLQICEKQLKDLLKELEKRIKGDRAGWERIKGAFLARNTRESVENLHRQCEALNHMVSIDMAVLGATTYKEVKDTRREQQDARKEQQKWHQDERVKDLLNWLSMADHGSQQRDFLCRRQEGTGQWLLDSNEFQTWCSKDGDILFCPGMPGAGKTIMASIVIDYLYTKYQNDDSVAVAYLYCNFRRRDEQKPIDMLASLLKQLILGLSNIPDGVKNLYDYHDSRQTRPSLQEISKELCSVIAACSKCFIVVDALDECPTTDGSRQIFLAELLNLRVKTGVNIFATSRHIPQIVQEFTGTFTTLEIRASDNDVRRYLNGHMMRLPSFVMRSVDLQEEVEAEIVKAVKGM
jgi:Cdc6-like AAA superfamily ATPase